MSKKSKISFAILISFILLFLFGNIQLVWASDTLPDFPCSPYYFHSRLEVLNYIVAQETKYGYWGYVSGHAAEYNYLWDLQNKFYAVEDIKTQQAAFGSNWVWWYKQYHAWPPPGDIPIYQIVYGSNWKKYFNFTTSPSISGKGASGLIAQSDTSRNYKSKDPVDTATGAYTFSKTLLSLKGAIPLDFTLSYNSLLLEKVSLGRGWNHNFETKLQIQPQGIVRVQWDSNHYNTFSESLKPYDQACAYDKLTKQPDGTYKLVKKDQKSYTFNESGKLIQLQNPHMQATNMTYDDTGRLNTVTEPITGSYLSFEYNADGTIALVKDSSGRQVTFGYDTQGNLTKITDAEGFSTDLTYDADGRVISAVDNNGTMIFTNTYDSSGRVISQKDSLGAITAFSYDESIPFKIISTLTNRNSDRRILTHNWEYNLEKVEDELGNITTYTYDDLGNCTSKKDALNNEYIYTLDSNGNMITKKDPYGNIVHMTYDARNNLLSDKNALNKQTTYIYDANNNITSIVDPLNNTTIYDYDSNGLLKSIQNPSGTTEYTYQGGQLNKTIDPEGVTTTYSYDAAGRVTGITDINSKTLTKSYDDSGNLLSITDPIGNTTSYEYDCYGSMLKQIDPNGNATSYVYNANGKLIEKEDALQNKTLYEYGPEDWLTKITDPRENSFVYSYDKKGRLEKITDQLGHTTTYGYDNADRLVSIIDALGQKILTNSFDKCGNVLTATDAQNHIVTKQYDATNRLIQTTDQLSHNTKLTYDDLDRLISAEDPLNGTSKMTYDASGNVTKIIDPNVNSTSFTYDRADRVTTRLLPTGSTLSYKYNRSGQMSESTNGRLQTTSYTFDDAGKLAELTDSEGAVSFKYDNNGNTLEIRDSSGTSNYEYDALNRVKSYTDIIGNAFGYKYDANGNLIELTYPDGKKVLYTYDAANRLTKVTDWQGRETIYEFDANNRLITTLRPDGSTESKSYDIEGQLTQIKDIKDGSIINQYDLTYDAGGKVLSEKKLVPDKVTDVLGSLGMTYTAGNKLATVNGNAIEFDSDGNMTNGLLNGVQANFTFDSRNRLIQAGGVTYTYDSKNIRIAVQANGKKLFYAVNPIGAMSQVLMEKDQSGNVNAWYVYGLGLIGRQDIQENYQVYHSDMRGSTVALSDEDGRITDRYYYGPYGGMLLHEGTSDQPFCFNGREGVMTDSNGLFYMRARYYHPTIKRFINMDVVSGEITDGQTLNRYAYVMGNPVSNVDPFGLSRIDLTERHYENDVRSAFIEMSELKPHGPVKPTETCGACG